MHFLSIIMPCYNCQKTVEEAVASIFTQQIQIPFEVILVDDHSTDSTLSILKKLQKKHQEIKIYTHTQNLGGGAARNTAFSKSRGDLIFCLDSDDLMGDNMLPPMIDMLISKKLDGVGVHISKKFNGSNVERIAYVNEFQYVNQIIPFESYFESSTCAIMSTFMHTRKAFDVCGGYPIDHGFDTQSFGFRFLANGLNASVCPDTVYLHRVNFHRSYYIREEESGKVAQNLLKIYEEYFYLFSEKVQRFLLECDLRTANIYPLTLSQQFGSQLFVRNYHKHLYVRSKQQFHRLLQKKGKRSPFESYWLACYEQSLGEFQNAITFFAEAIKGGLNTRTVRYRLAEATAQLADLPVEQFISEDIQRETVKLTIIKMYLRRRNDLVRLVRQII